MRVSQAYSNPKAATFVSHKKKKKWIRGQTMLCKVFKRERHKTLDVNIGVLNHVRSQVFFFSFFVK